jgi:hypothetical protein
MSGWRGPVNLFIYDSPVLNDDIHVSSLGSAVARRLANYELERI